MIIHFAIDDLKYYKHVGNQYDASNVSKLIDDLMLKHECIWVFHNRTLSAAKSGLFWNYFIGTAIIYYENDIMNLLIIQYADYDYDTEEHIDRSKHDDEICFLTVDQQLYDEFGLINKHIAEYCACRREILKTAKKYNYNAESGNSETRYNTLAIYRNEESKNKLIYKLFMKYGFCQFVNKVECTSADVPLDGCIMNVVNGKAENTRNKMYKNTEIITWFENIQFESDEDLKAVRTKIKFDISKNDKLEYDYYEAISGTRERKITK